MSKQTDSTDRCAHCDTLLNTCEEIHAVEGVLYCSKECAINEHIEFIINSAKEMATEWYNDCAEVINPADIGILKH